MFWFIHIMAFVFFIPALLVTIPLHIIAKKLDRQNAKTVESAPEVEETEDEAVSAGSVFWDLCQLAFAIAVIYFNWDVISELASTIANL